MKKIMILLAVPFLMVSCSKESPKDNAQKFLNAYYTSDMDAAMEVGTSETKEFLAEIKKLIEANPFPDSIKELQKQVKIEIAENGVEVMDTTATVNYTIIPPASTGAPSLNKSLKMVKSDGKWLASYTYMDYMNEMQAEMQEMQQQSQAADSTLNAMEEVDETVQNEANKQQQATESATEEAAPAE